jgi:hypothetical protein
VAAQDLGPGGARFPAEAFAGLRILEGIVGRKFKSLEQPEVCVFGLVNHPHPAAAEQFGSPAVGDSLARSLWADRAGEPAVSGENRQAEQFLGRNSSSLNGDGQQPC